MAFNKILQRIKQYEFGRYVIGGGSVTLLNAGVYTVLLLCGIKAHWANLAALGLAKFYGYFINKFFVYRTRGLSRKETVVEASKYFSIRGFTGILDFVLVLFLVEFARCSPFYSKYGVMVLVIVLNYFLGKYLVFKNKNTEDC